MRTTVPGTLAEVVLSCLRAQLGPLKVAAEWGEQCTD